MRRGGLLGGIVAIATAVTIASCGSFSPSEDDGLPAADAGGGGADGGAGGSADGELPKGDASADAAGLPPLRVFITKSLVAGQDVSKISCQGIAVGEGLGGAWVAWLSFPGIDAKNAVPDTGPWTTLAGDVVATNKSDLLSGKIQHAIDRDETNTPRTNDAWTGTTTSGTATAFTCAVWNKGAGLYGTYGTAGATDGRWTDWTTASCDEQKSVYCLEIRP